MSAVNQCGVSKSRSLCLPGEWRSAQSRFGGRESVDHCHWASTLWAGPEWSRNISLWRADDRLRFGSCGQQLETQREQLRTAPVSQEPEVPDAHEAPRQHVQKEPSQKLIERQLHQPFLVVVHRVAPAEQDLAVLQRNRAVIGDRYPVPLTTEIAERVLGSSERAFCIDHPLGTEQAPQHGRKGSWRSQTRQAAVETGLAGRMQFTQPCHELSPEDPAEDVHWQEESGA